MFPTWKSRGSRLLYSQKRRARHPGSDGSMTEGVRNGADWCAESFRQFGLQIVLRIRSAPLSRYNAVLLRLSEKEVSECCTVNNVMLFILAATSMTEGVRNGADQCVELGNLGRE
ncbi:hypothetical protein GCK32_002390 [Trichostrongylus colubriformis]|uniref:Uncharacterized protein n=1 Tax=Trichostrongylus colubriformis TaxID=6319 RepID=A0AAN8IK23_TRICO